MSTCVYCKKNATLTREHVIPNWFIQENKSELDTGFFEVSKKKFVKEIVVRDVCSECNNGFLSKLDSYGKELYGSYFSKFVFSGESVDFEYDANKLLKWTIKCSFNSARANGSDLEILNDYAEKIFSEKLSTTDIIAFCSLVSPSIKSDDGDYSIASRAEAQVAENPYWFRVGLFRVPNIDTIDYCFRTIIINSFAFFLAIPRLGIKKPILKSRIIKSMASGRHFGVRLTNFGKVKLKAPSINSNQSISNHYINNPFTYGLVNDPIQKALSKNKIDEILYAISRDDVENTNLNDTLNFLSHIVSCREAVLSYASKIEFSIGGYEQDSRELFQIPEVLHFLKIVDEEFPYWLAFQSDKGKWLKALLFVLCYEANGCKSTRVELNKEGIIRVSQRWFNGLNELCHKFLLGETFNRRASEKLSKIINEIQASI